LASARKDFIFRCRLFITALFASRRAYSASGPDSEYQLIHEGSNLPSPSLMSSLSPPGW
jgi:hypothetical protein